MNVQGLDISSLIGTLLAARLDSLRALLPSAVDDFLSELLAIMQGGGLPMWILLGLAIMLWYALGYRLFLLRRGRAIPVRQRIKRVTRSSKRSRDRLDHILSLAVDARREADRSRASRRHFVEGALIDYRLRLARHRILIRTIVMVAPLIGLLGTVSGMIETFEALETNALFSQGSSISSGISQAMYTTQMGLLVGLPGLLIGRMLDRREKELADDLDQAALLIALPNREPRDVGEVTEPGVLSS